MKKKQIDIEIQLFAQSKPQKVADFEIFKRRILEGISDFSQQLYILNHLKILQNTFVDKNSAANKIEKNSKKGHNYSTKKSYPKEEIINSKSDNQSVSIKNEKEHVSEKQRARIRRRVCYLRTEKINPKDIENRIVRNCYLGKSPTTQTEQDVLLKLGLEAKGCSAHYNALPQQEKIYRLWNWSQLESYFRLIPLKGRCPLPNFINHSNRIPFISEWELYGKAISECITKYKQDKYVVSVRHTDTSNKSKFGIVVPNKGDRFRIVYSGISY